MGRRPILKSHSPEGFPLASVALPFLSPLDSPHVHFPPTPTLTSIHPTHSQYTYDRAPIVVSPNMCALPERGGRMYSPQTSPELLHSIHYTTPKGGYFHPRAFEACEREMIDEGTASNPPTLIPDLSASSSSEVSDDPEVYCPALPPIPTRSTSTPDFTYPFSQSHLPKEISAALSFLPHPPSPRAEGQRKLRLKKRGIEDGFRSTTSELSEGCLGGF